MYAGKYLNQVRWQYITEEDLDVEDNNDDMNEQYGEYLTDIKVDVDVDDNDDDEVCTVWEEGGRRLGSCSGTSLKISGLISSRCAKSQPTCRETG